MANKTNPRPVPPEFEGLGLRRTCVLKPGTTVQQTHMLRGKTWLAQSGKPFPLNREMEAEVRYRPGSVNGKFVFVNGVYQVVLAEVGVRA